VLRCGCGGADMWVGDWRRGARAWAGACECERALRGFAANVTPAFAGRTVRKHPTRLAWWWAARVAGRGGRLGICAPGGATGCLRHCARHAMSSSTLRHRAVALWAEAFMTWVLVSRVASGHRGAADRAPTRAGMTNSRVPCSVQWLQPCRVRRPSAPACSRKVGSPSCSVWPIAALAWSPLGAAAAGGGVDRVLALAPVRGER